MARAQKDSDKASADSNVNDDPVNGELNSAGTTLLNDQVISDEAHGLTAVAPAALTAAPGETPEPLAVMAAFNEIQAEADAAKHALAHVKANSLPESVVIPEMDKSAASAALTQEQSEQLFEKKRIRALRERERGLARLTQAPTRTGEMVLTRNVTIADVAVANMAKRFVYIADRLLARLHGYGAMIMGEDKAAAAVEIMSAHIDELHRGGKMLYDQSKQALVVHRERMESEGTEFYEFTCQNLAMEVEIHLLRREGNKFLEALVLYDKAIAEMRKLEFNYGTDTDQIEQHLSKVRKDAYKIYRSALAGQVELGRILAGRRAKKNDEQLPAGEQDNSTGVRTGDLVEA